MTTVLTKPELDAKLGADPAVKAGSIDDAEAASLKAVLRNLVDFLLVIFIAAVVFKAFVAEGYYVPSGSMAPNLFGFHHSVHCRHCGHEFAIGADDSHGVPVSVACPMCRSNVGVDLGRIDAGDRLLVLKWFHEFRAPRRWETVVFRNPNDAGQAYIKRAIGLPRETVAVESGDVLINGKIARKSFDQLTSMRLGVYDHTRVSRRDGLAPRFDADSTSSSWKFDGERLLVDAVGSRAAPAATYRHLGPLGRDGPINDDNPYNGWQNDTDNQPVTDLILQLRARHEEGKGSIGLRYQSSSGAPFEVRLFPTSGRVDLLRDGRPWKTAQTRAWNQKSRTIVFAYWDRQVTVRVDDEAPFGDLAVDTPVDRTTMNAHPFVLLADDSRWIVDELRIDRDVYYRTESKPEALGADEYFMLGDNSPISNDSRKWNEPAVPGSLLVGKPLWVHLPTFALRGNILGRSLNLAIPDLSRIRAVK